MSEDVETPIEAGRPKVKGPTKTYQGERITVFWDATRCIHVADCTRLLPQVFDVKKRPWIDVTGADAESIAETIRRCPTGALRYAGSADLPEEQPDEPVTVEVRPGGPLYIRGAVRVTDVSGQVLAEEARVALCRCGASANRPFCDNSHRAIGFTG